jgi:hypothetical protein
MLWIILKASTQSAISVLVPLMPRVRNRPVIIPLHRSERVLGRASSTTHQFEGGDYASCHALQGKGL